MKKNYDEIMEGMLESEGGYVDHPQDPGGATKYGITHKNLAAWRGVAPYHNLPKSEVKNLTLDEAKAIYKKNYWDKVRGDELPSGLDYTVYDYGVNSGPNRSIKQLQKVLGVEQDGVIGNNTLNALRNAKDIKTLIHRFNDDRMAFLRGLGTFKTFGKGWTARVERVRAKSLLLAEKDTEVLQNDTDKSNPWGALIPILGALLTAFFGWLTSRR